MDLSRRDFLKLTSACLAGASLAAGCRPRAGRVRARGRRVVILGFDGLDPHLITAWMKQGFLPNLERLARRGGWALLGTSTPPQSPVAWANFITGMDPSGHGIFDFLHRDPSNYGPGFSITSTHPAAHTLRLGKWVLPLSKAQIALRRKGPAFWKVLERHGVPSAILHIPSNFPPEETSARTLSGLGTPDIQGSYGHFSFYTTQPPKDLSRVTGGTIYPVKVENGVVTARLEGPPNSFRRSGGPAAIRFRVYVDESNPVAQVEIEGRRLILKQGEWSDWVELTFRLAPLAKVSGICRFYLKSARPFELYVSPVNINPADPAMPVTTPADYGRELQRHLGFFYTQGMAEDTKALSSGVLSDDEFLDQARFIFQEQKAIFEYELSRLREGVVFGYFSGTDLVVHMFWRATDPQHPLWTPDLARRHGSVIRETYMERDRLLGKTMAVVGDEALVMVVSDHGFAPYRRSFDLNAWLMENGYLSADPQAKGPLFERADWSRSQAYAIGFNGLYVNEAEREGEGIVSPGPRKERLLDELCARLAEARDPKTGARAIHAVRRTSQCYDSRFEPENAPDAIVGFERGYRMSWEAALGEATEGSITDNDGKWSGDHCMDPDVIPGVVFASRPIRAEAPALLDIAPTVLTEYGVSPPRNMIGKPIL